MLKDFFGCAKHHEKITYGSGYTLTIKTRHIKAVKNQAGAKPNPKQKS